MDNQWFVYFYYQHPETQKFIRFRKWISSRIKTATGRRKKAAELKSYYNNLLKRGWNPFADQEKRLTTLTEAVEYALSIKSKTVGKRTISSYRSICGIFLNYLKKKSLLGIAIDEMSKEIAWNYFDYIIVKHNYSARTYNNHLTALKTIFNFLIKREYLQFNPFNTVDSLREPEPELTAFKKSELSAVSCTLPEYDYQLYVITQFIFYCFIRPAEIVRLQFRDVLWEHDLIVLPGNKSKNKKSEVIVLPNQLKTNLRNWDRDYPEDYYLFSKNLDPGNVEIAPTRIAEAWRKYADEYGIKKALYDLKHTGNGFAFDLGFNSRDIQLQNRHSSLEETQRYLNKFRRVASEKFKKEFTGY